jgi:myo-inositol-1(or 4)-monophosphatase
MDLEPDELTSFFNALCDLASVETLSRFRKPVDITNKLSKGFDPVTEADKAAEQVIRKAILERFSDHGIVGEEFGATNPDADYQWIIDPIDGTKAYISGLPSWGTLIGLYKSGHPHAGIMHQPFTDERYICDGDKSFLNHKGDISRLQTSTTQELGDAIIMTTSPALFNPVEVVYYERLEALCKLPRYGADCYAYCMLASGHIDLVVEAGLNAYDIAALIPIVEKSGGIFTDWQGGSPAQGGQVLVAANKVLHEKAMATLA